MREGSKMAKLFYRYSSMAAGKTLDLLKVAYNYKERNRNVLLLTSALDDRYQVGLIKSRVGLSEEAEVVYPKTNIYELVSTAKELDCVLIDEVQFLTKEQVNQLSDVVDYLKIPVICYGLRTDYRGEPFEASAYLLSVADSIEEIKTICHCGKKATFNARVVNGEIVYEGDQIVIDKEGSESVYVPLCRYHWKTGEHGLEQE